jgi:hypothetical protein
MLRLKDMVADWGKSKKWLTGCGEPFKEEELIHGTAFPVLPYGA